jgi:hypothetical protein
MVSHRTNWLAIFCCRYGLLVIAAIRLLLLVLETIRLPSPQFTTHCHRYNSLVYLFDRQKKKAGTLQRVNCRGLPSPQFACY